MNKFFAAILCMLCVLTASTAFAEQQDRKGSEDHPLLTRMPEFYIDGYTDTDFERTKFLVKESDKVTPVFVEGHKYYFQYNLKQGAKSPGELKVVRNIQAALAKIGGEVLFEGERPWSTTIRLVKDGKETWVGVASFPTLYRLTIVEKEVMEQVVEASAEVMNNDISTTGHVSVYGIYFDTAKADIKPESDAAIAEIAKLLNNKSALKLYVVGHTDNTGTFDGNMKLSKDRAAAVTAALVSKHGINASRLKAYGTGSLCPVAANKTEDGKAKNRRVELVEQ